MVGLRMKRILRSIISAVFFSSLLLSTASWAHDGLLFEGYYRVLKSGQHVGYFIVKHEFDAKKKQFVATTFMQLEGDEPMTESIRAVANEEFAPVNYAYTAMGSGATRTIDIKVNNNKMTGTILTKGDKEKVSRTLKKGTISSLFLIYSLLRSPQGIKPGAAYKYEALAEELAEVKEGEARVTGTETLNGTKVYRIENDFLKTKSSNLVSETGEVLATLSAAQKIAVELVPTPEAAIGKFRVQNALLKSLFGEVPKGEKNSLAKGTKKDGQ